MDRLSRAVGLGCVGEDPYPVGSCGTTADGCYTKYKWDCTVGNWQAFCVPPGLLNYDFPVGGSCGPTCPEPCAPEEERSCTPSGATTACGIETCENNVWSACSATRGCDDEGDRDGDCKGSSNSGGDSSGPSVSDGGACSCVSDPIDVTTGYFDWTSHRDDAPLETELGGLRLGRIYASRRVAYDLMRVDSEMPASARAIDVASTPSNGLGTGWTHAYDHWLVVGTDVLHVHPNAGSTYYDQDTSVPTTYWPRNFDGSTLKYANAQWVLENSDHSRLIFEGASLARLVTIINARQQRLDLKYYGASEPDSCSSSNSAIQGKLCTIKDPNGSTIRLIYDSTGLLSETRYNAPGASSYNTTSYAYTGFDILDHVGRPMGYQV